MPNATRPCSLCSAPIEVSDGSTAHLAVFYVCYSCETRARQNGTHTGRDPVLSEREEENADEEPPCEKCQNKEHSADECPHDDDQQGELDEYEGPSDGDYQINPVGQLGSKTAAGIVKGRYLGTFDTDEQALRAIREHGNRANYRPNVWNVSDHGNAHLVEGFEWDSRGTWQYSYGDETEDGSPEAAATFTLYCAEPEPEKIKRDLSSVGGCAIENADGLLMFTVDAAAVDAAIEELRDANFEAKEGS